MSPMALQSTSIVCANTPEMGLELGERHFDRVEVGAVGRQEEEPSSALLEDSLGLCTLVTGEVVEDYHITLLQRRGELGLDIGVEDLAIHRAVDDPWCDEAVAPQSGDEGLRGPVSEGRIGFQSSAPASPATQTGHLGRCAGFVEEDQPMDPLPHQRLALRPPLVTCLAHVLAPGLRGQQCFF